MSQKLKSPYTTSEWSTKKPLLIEKDRDKRYRHYAKQLKKDGFCDSETWNLFTVIAKFTLPRLIRFREIVPSYPMGRTPEQWHSLLDDMIWSFKYILEDPEVYDRNATIDQTKLNDQRCSRGME